MSASAARKALITAQNENGGEEDPKEQAVFRQKQRDKDPCAGPEQDDADCFFHRTVLTAVVPTA